MKKKKCDVTIVGSCKKADGIGQNAIGFVSCLYKQVELNVVHTCTMCGDGLNSKMISIFKKQPESSGHVAILTSSIFWYDSESIYEYLPKESDIKIAYSMIESTKLAERGVNLLNEVFDAVVVPDPWLIEVYKSSGVRIPIFTLPIALGIEDFLQEPVSRLQTKPFVFLNTCAFMERKNHLLLIDAFHEVFGTREDVQLILHGRRGSSSDSFSDLEAKIHHLKAPNILLQRETLPRKEYLALMKQAHCFVSLSKGEGFGVPPREAMALGIPCILTENSAHQTCCNTGFVRSIPSEIPEIAFCPLVGRYTGEEFNCKKEDAKQALWDLFENYKEHLQKARKGRKWARQYLPSHLRAKYLNLVKPKKIILGDRDEIGESYLMTTSEKLYQKYLNLKER